MAATGPDVSFQTWRSTATRELAVPRDRHTQARRHSTAAFNLLGLCLSFLIYYMEILTVLCPEVYMYEESECLFKSQGRSSVGKVLT